jgi:hypothetical protein
MKDRPIWIQLLYKRHSASYALHSAFLLEFVNGLVVAEADAQPNGREQLRQVALSELNSPDPQVVAISLLFLGVVGRPNDISAVEGFGNHQSDLVQKAARTSLFELRQENRSARISGD